MKGFVRIGGALLLGAILVLGAFSLRPQDEQPGENGVAVAIAPARQYIEAADSDADGVPDWEEGLSSKVYERIALPTTTTAVATYTPPTTFTGKFSEAFFQDYLEGKTQSGDALDTTALVNNAIQAIDKNTESKKYTPRELTIIPTTKNAVRTYGNEVASILQGPSADTENEMLILQRALDAGEPELLDALSINRDGYEKMVANALMLDVPEAVVSAHINLLNALTAILVDIEAMQMAFTDPLYALARVRGYEEDSNDLLHALQEITRALVKYDVMYTSDEPGSFFNMIGIGV